MKTDSLLIGLVLFVMAAGIAVVAVAHHRGVEEMRLTRNEIGDLRVVMASVAGKLEALAAPNANSQPITNTAEGGAGGEVTNNIYNDDPTAAIRQRGERNGYFTTEDFTGLEGISDRTFRNWVDEGRIQPEPVKAENGRWQIPLEYRVLP